VTEDRFDAAAITAFARAALTRSGLPAAPAESVARILVEADLLGHTTHGLALLADYVEEIEDKRMAVDGMPEVLADKGAVATWDARRLPGIWTTELAIDEAAKRAKLFGMGAVALRRSHHIACLAAFLEKPARDGLVVMVFSSDPGESRVAPYGALTPVLMPDPIAIGIPGTPDPVMIDISTSITTMALTNRTKREGGRMPGRWLLDSQGVATDDPKVIDGGGTLLPVGGMDHGHKGFGFGLLVEMLTQGLSGYGRADEPKEWGAAVLVLVFDPSAFSGLDGFLRQADFIAEACRDAKPISPDAPVRLPGQAGLARKKWALGDGLAVNAGILRSLEGLEKKLGLLLPQRLPAAG
jgi:LDH2 family malate/lactate/ureidoglycolate dehydrogenase